MSILSFLHFFAFLIYLYLLVIVLWKDPKSPLNRVCAAFLACFAEWSFGVMFCYGINPTKDTVWLWDRIASPGWCSFASFFLWFSLIFTEKKKLLKTKIIYPLIFIPPLLFTYQMWAGSFTAGYTREYYGWVATPSGSIWYYLYYVYYLLFAVGGIYLIFDFKKKTKKTIKKKQAGIILTTVLITLVLGTLFNVILPRLNIRTIPPIGDITALIWGGGLAYAIIRYKLMVITPAVAADSIISTMADSLILLDREGNIVTVNKATLDLSGYGKNELEGKSVDRLFPEKNFKSTLLDRAIKGEAVRNYELNFKTKTRDIIPVIFSSSTMMDEAGGLTGIVCITRDITELKRLEKARVESEKLATIGQLAGGVAHELRSPLWAIKNAIYYLKKKVSKSKLARENPQIAEFLQIADKEIDSSNRIISNLLDFTRVPKPLLKEAQINEVIEDALTLTQLPPNIKIIKELDPELPLLPIDKDQIRGVFSNIIRNAFEAMAKKGELRMKSRKKEKSIHVEFADTGRGIPKEVIGKIFDPLFTSKAKGVGLGLAICEQIIKAHKGEIKVKSEEGKGATFTVILPIDDFIQAVKK